MTSFDHKQLLFLNLDSLCFEFEVARDSRSDKSYHLLAKADIDESMKLDALYDFMRNSIKPIYAITATPSLLNQLTQTISLLKEYDDIDRTAFYTISNIALSVFDHKSIKKLIDIRDVIKIVDWPNPLEYEGYVVESMKSSFSGYYAKVHNAVTKDINFYNTPQCHMSKNIQHGNYNLFADINIHLMYLNETKENLIRINNLIAEGFSNLPKGESDPSDYFKGFSEVPYEQFASKKYKYLYDDGILAKEINEKGFPYKEQILDRFKADDSNNQNQLKAKKPITLLTEIQTEVLQSLYGDDLESRCLEKVVSSFIKSESHGAMLKSIKSKDFEDNINEFFAITGRLPTFTEIIKKAEDQLVSQNNHTLFDKNINDNLLPLSLDIFEVNKLFQSLDHGVLKKLLEFEPPTQDEIKEPPMRGAIFIKKNNPLGAVVKTLSPPQQEVQELIISRIKAIETLISNIKKSDSALSNDINLESVTESFRTTPNNMKRLCVFMNTIMMLSDFASRTPQNLMQTCIHTNDIEDYWPIRLRNLIEHLNTFDTGFSKSRLSTAFDIKHNRDITITDNGEMHHINSLIKPMEIKLPYVIEGGFKNIKEYVKKVGLSDEKVANDIVLSDILVTKGFQIKNMDSEEFCYIYSDVLNFVALEMITFNNQVESLLAEHLKKISSTMFKKIIKDLDRSEDLLVTKEVNKTFSTKKDMQDKEYLNSVAKATL